ncbi:MAG TPA: DUF192 domain-containing protein [Candidatus Bilamarchaeum sp.]|nr:DUF192 domain-containing protein [Candidatus Bilamarchaeum sp.]
MKGYEVAVIVAAVILVILIVYFATAKGEKRKLTLVNADGKEIAVYAEIANSTATRAKGLMGRTSLPENDGMLFIFAKPDFYGFWMLNTSIPLDAIHFDADGTVVDVIPMKPCGFNITACPNYLPRAKSMYVLEVNQGFAEMNGIEIKKSRLVLDK